LDVVILCVGKGTCFSEETIVSSKLYFSKQDFKNFKKNVSPKYFLNANNGTVNDFLKFKLIHSTFIKI
jgi:hypothetical protein